MENGKSESTRVSRPDGCHRKRPGYCSRPFADIAHGIDLIPELESFGHTGYITRSPAYAHLLDSEPQGSSEFTGVIPVSSETLQLFDKLYREVAKIFSSAYLHGGCDEVNWRGSRRSRKALQAKTRAQIWATYSNSLDGMSRGLGKTFIVWGDFVLHKEPEILGQLNKSIVIMDWNYRDDNSAPASQGVREDRCQRISRNRCACLGELQVGSANWH